MVESYKGVVRSVEFWILESLLKVVDRLVVEVCEEGSKDVEVGMVGEKV